MLHTTFTSSPRPIVFGSLQPTFAFDGSRIVHMPEMIHPDAIARQDEEMQALRRRHGLLGDLTNEAITKHGFFASREGRSATPRTDLDAALHFLNWKPGNAQEQLLQYDLAKHYLALAKQRLRKAAVLLHRASAQAVADLSVMRARTHNRMQVLPKKFGISSNHDIGIWISGAFTNVGTHARGIHESTPGKAEPDAVRALAGDLEKAGDPVQIALQSRQTTEFTGLLRQLHPAVSKTASKKTLVLARAAERLSDKTAEMPGIPPQLAYVGHRIATDALGDASKTLQIFARKMLPF